MRDAGLHFLHRTEPKAQREQTVSTEANMKPMLSVLVLAFALGAVAQMFLPCRLPNAIAYAACAWILAKTRKCL